MQVGGVREFFRGEMIKTDLLLVWLEKHGIAAESSAATVGPVDEVDLSREMIVRVADADYDRAHALFFTEREDEL
jgi:hypothetical protein